MSNTSSRNDYIFKYSFRRLTKKNNNGVDWTMRYSITDDNESDIELKRQQIDVM